MAAGAASAELRLRLRRATWALAAREMRRVLGLWTQTLLPPVITGLIFLAIFGGALGGRLHTVSGVPYVRFILPGLLVMTVAAQAFANNSTSFFQAKNEGYLEDILTSPLRPRQIVIAYMAGGLLRGWLSALALALIASPFAGAPHDPLLLVAALILCGLVSAALGVITGIWADTFDQHAFIANLLISPLALLGGVFLRCRAPAPALAVDHAHRPAVLPRRRHTPRLGRHRRDLAHSCAARRARHRRRAVRDRRRAHPARLAP